MITYFFEPNRDAVFMSVRLCGVEIYSTQRLLPVGADPYTHFDTESSRATLLEAAQPTIDALRSYFENHRA